MINEKYAKHMLEELKKVFHFWLELEFVLAQNIDDKIGIVTFVYSNSMKAWERSSRKDFEAIAPCGDQNLKLVYDATNFYHRFSKAKWFEWAIREIGVALNV